MGLDRNKNAGFKKPIVSPEEININRLYTFNYNPREQRSHYKNPKVRWYKMYNEIQTAINTKFAEIFGELEISRTGRIHMHGYIKFKDIAGFYLRDVPQMLQGAEIEIDTIEDHCVWEKYVMKSNVMLSGYATKINNNTLPQPEIVPSLEHEGIVELMKRDPISKSSVIVCPASPDSSDKEELFNNEGLLKK